MNDFQVMLESVHAFLSMHGYLTMHTAQYMVDGTRYQRFTGHDVMDRVKAVDLRYSKHSLIITVSYSIVMPEDKGVVGNDAGEKLVRAISSVIDNSFPFEFSLDKAVTHTPTEKSTVSDHIFVFRVTDKLDDALNKLMDGVLIKDIPSYLPILIK